MIALESVGVPVPGEARDTLSCIRVLDIGKAIPNQPADIQLIVQDAGAAPPVAVDRRRSISKIILSDNRQKIGNTRST
jgi:hypothetical protein